MHLCRGEEEEMAHNRMLIYPSILQTQHIHKHHLIDPLKHQYPCMPEMTETYMPTLLINQYLPSSKLSLISSLNRRLASDFYGQQWQVQLFQFQINCLNVHIQYMKYYLLLLTAINTLSQAQILNSITCPSTSNNHIISSTISLTLNTPTTRPNSQTSIYTYTPTKPFANIPNVAIGITHFQSQASPYLMLKIKALYSASTNGLSFLVRFYYRYTNWNRIQFNFIAEDREDIQANYYQVDTHELVTSESTKAIEVILPFISTYNSPKLIYLLQGFEIETAPIQPSSSINCPFEVQIAIKNQSNKNARLILSTISTTKIMSIILSYLVYETSHPLYQNGYYEYKDFNTISYLNIPIAFDSKHVFLFSGMAGFVIPNDQGNSKASVQLIQSSLVFNFNPPAYYINYQYFMLLEPNSQCFYCRDYPYQSKGECVSECPLNASLAINRCVQCQLDQILVGASCNKMCSGGSIWNAGNKKCECPGLLIWDGENCIICGNGKIWLPFQLKCGCSQSQFWNNYFCQDIHSCPQNQTFSQQALACKCSDEYYLKDSSCLKCPNGSINGSCVCLGSSTWNGYVCSNCSNSMRWSSQLNSCVCVNGLFNGIGCVQCTGGRIVMQTNLVCVCPSSHLWNGQTCLKLCASPLIYTNGACNCPQKTYLKQNNCIATPQCPDGMFWFNTGCAKIECQVGYYWSGSNCVKSDSECPANAYWDGQSCIFYNLICPNGSNWNGTYCITKAGNCLEGTYVSNGVCIYFPQLCLPKFTWDGQSCLIVDLSSVSCLKNQYYNGFSCVEPNCTNGKLWNTNLMQCICSESTFWNGLQCINCPQNQVFSRDGCTCKEGFFLINSNCIDMNYQYCLGIENAQWINNHCACKAGFAVVGLSCVCNGIITGDVCDVCYKVANTVMKEGKCQCKTGYYQSNSQCVPFQPNNITNISCQIGTVLHSNFQVCVACSDGCLSCKESTFCLQCRPQYTYDWRSYSCIQICGDGRRFTLGCDDGNNANGDGCSSDCHIEEEYTCFGGSPISSDFCTLYIPPSIVINIRGVTHLFGQIIVNVMTNYLPFNITDSSKPCDSLCNTILSLDAKGMFAPLAYTHLISEYRKGSLNSFGILLSFGKEPIDPFVLKVGINGFIGNKYMPSVDISKSFEFQINPAYLSIVTMQQTLT